MFSLFRRLVDRSRREETAIAISNNANPIDEDVDSTLRRIASPDAFTNFVNEFRLDFLRSKGRDRLTLQESSKLRKAASVEWSRLSDRHKRKYKQLATDWRDTRMSVSITVSPEAAESTNTSQPLTLVHVDNVTIAQSELDRIRSNFDEGGILPERASTSRASRLAGLQIGQRKHRTAPKVMGLGFNRANTLQARNSIRGNGRGTARVQEPRKLQRTPRILRAQKTLRTSKRTFAIRSEQFIPRALEAPPMRRSPALPSIEDFASNTARVRSRAPKRARLVQPVDPRLHYPTSSTELAQSIVPRKMKKVESTDIRMPEEIVGDEAKAVPKKPKAPRKLKMADSSPIRMPENIVTAVPVASQASEIFETLQSSATPKKPRASRKPKMADSSPIRMPENIVTAVPVASQASEIFETLQSLATPKKPRASRKPKMADSSPIRMPENIVTAAPEIPETSQSLPASKKPRAQRKSKETGVLESLNNSVGAANSIKSRAPRMPKKIAEVTESAVPEPIAAQKNPKTTRKSRKGETTKSTVLEASHAQESSGNSMALAPIGFPEMIPTVERRSRLPPTRQLTDPIELMNRENTNTTQASISEHPRKRRRTTELVEVRSSSETFRSMCIQIDRFNALPRDNSNLEPIPNSEENKQNVPGSDGQ